MQQTKQVSKTSNCPKCGHKFMKSLEYCPNCGENQKDYQMTDCCSTSSEMPRVIVFHP